MKKKILGIFICMLLIATAIPAVGTMNIERKQLDDIQVFEFVTGEFIVKLKSEVVVDISESTNGWISLDISSLDVLNEKHHVTFIERLFRSCKNSGVGNPYLYNIFKFSVPQGSDILTIIEEYSLDQHVIYAEPNGIFYPCVIPNDEYFDYQWALHNTGQNFIPPAYPPMNGTPDCDIDAPEAWDIETGDPDIVIAIADSGINYTHPDLADKIWVNEDEIPSNGIDDDDNGYIDDIRGWDFYYNDSDPMDGNGHGTLCAGVPGMVANNNIGGAGVCWDCQIMPVQIANEDWDNYWTDTANGIIYAADNAADVISMSFGGYGVSSIMKDAVDYAYDEGVFLCAAAHNHNTSDKCYPAAYENVTAVAATNQHDERCDEDDWGPDSGSNYGEWVDVAAPGNLIGTTCLYLDPEVGYYAMAGGTSLATPMVAGLAALLLSKYPSLTPDEVKAIICDHVDPYNSTYYIGTGRINAYKALAAGPPDLYHIGSLSWTDVKPGSTVTDTFKVKNIGNPGSLLDWEIIEWPEDWGTWTFMPLSGDDLRPEDGDFMVEVEVVAPNEENEEFEGEVKVVNVVNPDDFEIIDVSLTTPRNKPFNFNFPLLELLFERFPNAFPILRQLLGL